MSPKRFDRYMIAVDLASNAKIARFTDREFRCLLQGVWPLAAKARPRGFLAVAGQPATATDVANQARCPRSVAAQVLAKMRSLEMLETDEQSGLEHVHDWEEINPEPRHDTTNTERQRRFRSRRNAVTNAPETLRNAGEVEVEVEVEDRGSSVSSSSSAAKRADEKATDDDRKLCRLLAEQMRERNPKAKIKSQTRWLTDMRLLRERDRNSPQELEQAIRWVFRDDFWGGVIQSPGNLRQHFAAIWDRMSHERGNVEKGRVEDSATFLARRGGA